jgi:SAM-dependent methyltransferase
MALDMDFKKASEIFDLYIDWDRRLAREMPYLISRLESAACRKVVDVACGTGAHAIALAEAGFVVTAMDPDPALLGKASALAGKAGVSLEFKEAAFADLPAGMEAAFDAAICMGNSISLAGPGKDLEVALSGLGSLLKPSGLLLVHSINYPMLAKRREDPWGPVRVLEDGGLILKGFIPRQSGPWDAVLIHLAKDEQDNWQRHPVRFELNPHSPSDLKNAARGAGLSLKAVQGGFESEAPDAPKSADLVYELIKKQPGQ